jgi:hypothetical protein
MSYANLIEMPNVDFFLEQTVNVGYGFNVYSVLRTIEILSSIPTDEWSEYHLAWVLLTYTITMTMGTYWYTRFWSTPTAITHFYKGKSGASICTPLLTTLSAVIFYAAFAVGFWLLREDEGAAKEERRGYLLAMFCGNLFQALNMFMASAFGGIGDDRTPPAELVGRPKRVRKFTNTYSDA